MPEFIDCKTNLDNLIQDISQNDEMFLGNKEHYFNVGQSAINCIKLALLASGRDLLDVKNILDLPCGYGRVMRMLKVNFPHARMTACDLLHDGVDFCTQMFGATPIYSDKQINNLKIEGKFDLIWCGSLLTHLDSDRWQDFLDFFLGVLERKGILVFTTHGRYVASVMSRNECDYGIGNPSNLAKIVHDYTLNGFGYNNYPNSDEYGISVSLPSYVISLIEKHSELRILTYLERGWDNHQDVIVCIKE